MDYELLVIGGGTAGATAAKAGIKLSRRVAILEEENFAGTCLARG